MKGLVYSRAVGLPYFEENLPLIIPKVYTTKLSTGSNLRAAGPSIRTSLQSNAMAGQISSARPTTQYAQSVSSTLLQSTAPHLARHSSGSTPYQLSDRYEYGPAPASEAKRIYSMSSVAAAFPPVISRSIGETIGHGRNGEGSPVMNETLSVIDEHITDLSTPRHSDIARDPGAVHDSDSEYSSHAGVRQASLADLDSDEESIGLSGTEVNQWDHKQTADHLRHLGVEPRHCAIFEEQEITGDVLLDMDQDFIFMKEYDFGVMGRRLKTWHRIRAFQDEIKGPRLPPSASKPGLDEPSESVETAQSRPAATGTILPRIPSLMEKPGLNLRQSQSRQNMSAQNTGVSLPLQMQQPPAILALPNSGSPRAAWRASTVPESPSRPSAASIREANHSRRHSSIDIGRSPSLEAVQYVSKNSISFHTKQQSLDRQWSMSSDAPKTNGAVDSTIKMHPVGQGANNKSASSLSLDPSAVDLDRGYFSGGEVETKRTRKFLRKRDSIGTAAHSRHSSIIEDPHHNVLSVAKHTRLGSADSIRDIVPQVTSPASRAYHSKAFKGRFRPASAHSTAPDASNGGLSPTVTNLEDGSTPSLLSSLKPENEVLGGASRLTSLKSKTIPNKALRVMGLRAISDAVTGSEKAFVTSPTLLPSPNKESPLQSPSRTGSSTPSATSKSLEIDNTDASSKGTEGLLLPQTPKLQNGARSKTKKETSAYIRGLEKKTPAEQRNGCDYSGWMKKKSSSIMTTWKPRLFILRGRRLSYYYSEDDTEEQGVIDISSHKVLVANHDPITTLHATITGATSSPTPSSNTHIGSAALEKAIANVPTKIAPASVPFFFKLVPPKAGLSRAVQFTKPTIHYFQVDNISVGRKWMGAMMKATIERDLAILPSSTNKQKTISLAKARARKERPPALKGTEGSQTVIEAGPKSAETGLNILGLSFDEPSSEKETPAPVHRKMVSLDMVEKPPIRPSEANNQTADGDNATEA